MYSTSAAIWQIIPMEGYPTFSTGFVQMTRVAMKSTSGCYNPLPPS